jgi:CRISPR/Cas system CSM-associated protein Csm3 (group 7 of RAMP superfamily)
LADQLVSRNGKGLPVIPGSTLAGSFKTNLSGDEQEGWLGIPKSDSKQKKISPSSFVFDDAEVIPGQESLLKYPVELRDGVTLLRESMTAKPDNYFQTEVVPVGTSFCFACRGDVSKSKIDDVKNKLRKFLFEGGQLGGNQNAGQGEWMTDKICWLQLDMSKPEDLKWWLNTGHGMEWKGDFNNLLKKNRNVKIESRMNDWKTNSDFEIHLSVEIKNGLHLSAGSSGIPEKGMPDIQQVQRQKIDYDNGNAKFDSEYVDYGTAIKGRFRTAMEMLLRTYLHHQNLDKKQILTRVPGDPSEFNQKTVPEEIQKFFGGKKYKGAWSVREKAWTGTPEKLSREDHIKIDEFTQQTIEHAKFDFAPLAQGKTDVFIRLNPGYNELWQKTLLYLTAELLALNLLPWGGHGSRGYLGAKVTFENRDKIKQSIDTEKFEKFNGFLNDIIKSEAKEVMYE